MLLLSTICFSQEKWRVLTFSNVTGTTIEGSLITTATATLSYELSNDYSISSWNGISYRADNKQSWLASQTTFDKKVKSFTFGVGYLYGTGNTNTFISNNVLTSDTFIVVKLQYSLKIK